MSNTFIKNKLTDERRSRIASNLTPKINFIYIVRMLFARIWQNKETEIRTLYLQERK